MSEHVPSIGEAKMPEAKRRLLISLGNRGCGGCPLFENGICAQAKPQPDAACPSEIAPDVTAPDYKAALEDDSIEYVGAVSGGGGAFGQKPLPLPASEQQKPPTKPKPVSPSKPRQSRPVDQRPAPRPPSHRGETLPEVVADALLGIFGVSSLKKSLKNSV